MTVIIGLAVVPSDGLKPYFLMGSDSKQVDLMEDDEGNHSYEINENAEKIYKVNGRLIGIAGKVPYNLRADYVSFLEEQDGNLESVCKLSVDYLKKYIKNYRHDTEIKMRCTIIIGACEKNQPEIARIEVDESNLSKAYYSTYKMDKVGFLPAYIGISEVEDLQREFENRVQKNSINYNILAVKKAATEYLKKAAERKPETCNQEIKFERLP